MSARTRLRPIRWIKKRQEHDGYASFVMAVPGGIAIRSVTSGPHGVTMAMVFVPCMNLEVIETFLSDWISDQ